MAKQESNSEEQPRRRKFEIWPVVWAICFGWIGRQFGAQFFSGEEQRILITVCTGGGLACGYGIALIMKNSRRWAKIAVFAASVALIIVMNVPKSAYAIYRSEDAGYTVLFPRHYQINVDMQTGLAVTYITATHETNTYAASSFEMSGNMNNPADYSQLGKNIIKGASQGGSLIEDKEVITNGYRGRKGVVRMPSGALDEHRVFVINGKVYHLVFSTSTGSVEEEKKLEFFNSFQVLTNNEGGA